MRYVMREKVAVDSSKHGTHVRGLGLGVQGFVSVSGLVAVGGRSRARKGHKSQT